jgi:hypothetical protein
MPPKFGDLSKSAADHLSDDFTGPDANVSSFKSKLKTNFEGLQSFRGEAGKDGATLTSAVNFDWGGKVATPAKLTWKFPKPLGIAGIAFDKLEMDKSGKQKLEAALDMDALAKVSGLNCNINTDLNFGNLGGTSFAATYKGISNAQIKCEVNADKLVKAAFTEAGAYSAEATYSAGGGATVGVKHSPASTLDVGVQYVTGPATFSALVQENFSAKTFHCFYKLNNDMNLGAVYNLGGKKNDGQWGAGLRWNVCDGTVFKGKVTGKAGSNMILSTAIKQTLAKGVTMTAGTNVPLDSPDKAMTWGLAFSVE